ncbi:hypothetical protein [Shewanella oncorhynchi]|uniref:hypothetical protein n=1 Tax=Shewanella oncorhynchi TaxID=2726434 RepID=UPI003D79B13B
MSIDKSEKVLLNLLSQQHPQLIRLLANEAVKQSESVPQNRTSISFAARRLIKFKLQVDHLAQLSPSAIHTSDIEKGYE